MRAYTEVAKHYTISDPVPVALHIVAHPGVETLLLRAAPELRERFGGTRVRLCIDDTRIVLLVDTTGDVDEADEKFSAFIRQWWIHNATPDHAAVVTLNFV